MIKYKIRATTIPFDLMSLNSITCVDTETMKDMEYGERTLKQNEWLIESDDKYSRAFSLHYIDVFDSIIDFCPDGFVELGRRYEIDGNLWIRYERR